MQVMLYSIIPLSHLSVLVFYFFRTKTFCTFATSVVCHSMHHKIIMSGFKEIIYFLSYLQCSHVISKKRDPQMQKN